MNRIEQFVEPSHDTYSYIAIHNVYPNEDTLLAYRFFIEDWLDNDILINQFLDIYQQNKPTTNNIFTREHAIISAFQEKLKERTPAIQNITKHCTQGRIDYTDVARKFFIITEEKEWNQRD